MVHSDSPERTVCDRTPETGGGGAGARPLAARERAAELTGITRRFPICRRRGSTLWFAARMRDTLT